MPWLLTLQSALQMYVLPRRGDEAAHMPRGSARLENFCLLETVDKHAAACCLLQFLGHVARATAAPPPSQSITSTPARLTTPVRSSPATTWEATWLRGTSAMSRCAEGFLERVTNCVQTVCIFFVTCPHLPTTCICIAITSAMLMTAGDPNLVLLLLLQAEVETFFLKEVRLPFSLPLPPACVHAVELELNCCTSQVAHAGVGQLATSLHAASVKRF